MLDINSKALVSSLIDSEICSWKEAEVDRLFLPMEASIIKAIPLSFSNKCDTIFWPRNHDEVYSVKFGYKLLMEMECGSGTDASSSSMGAMKSIWNEIWKLEVPNGTRLLMWRVGNDSLPTRVNLVRRKLLTKSTCPLCKLEPEDTLNALWKCPILSMVWQVSFADLVAGTNGISDFLDIIQRAQQDRSRFDLFAWTISLIWMCRNKIRVEEETFPLTKISSLACEGLQEY
nr:putative ribonuclease h protein [Quercus suber]